MRLSAWVIPPAPIVHKPSTITTKLPTKQFLFIHQISVIIKSCSTKWVFKMAFKQTILRANFFQTYGELHRKLRTLKSELNTSQVDAIADACEKSLPNEIALFQRTPKGTVYVHVDDECLFSIDQRGRVNT
jgi:hypothetical protein